MSVYVIMKQRVSAAFLAEAKPHIVVETLAEARLQVKSLNKRAMSNNYWHVKVPKISD